ncbi:MAG: biotin/lipoyl-binding protein [Gammaproteobacteria bacterium]|jgi:multidrug efflux pump subunit AcrA (membrane-fusion protein)
MDKKPLLTRIIIPLGIIGFAIVIAGTLFISRPNATIRDSEEKSWVVSVVDARPENISPQITIFGKVESPYMTRMTAAINADVEEVPVKEGQYVQQGQTLVKLNSADYELQLKQRKAELAEIKAQISSEQQRYKSDQQALKHEKVLLELAEKELERAKSLKRDNLSTQARIDETEQTVVKQQLALNNRALSVNDHQARLSQLKARATRAEALRDLAALDVKRSVITAPFSGKVTSVNVSPGDRAKVGDALLELYDQDTLEIRAQIPTQYESIIHQAISSGTEVSGNGKVNTQSFPVALDRISGKITLGSGGLDGLFRIEELSNQLQVGRTLELKISLPPVTEAIALPREAIYGSDRIYRLVNERMSALSVQRIGEIQGKDGANYVIVKSSAINPGDKIITTQLPNAIDGLLVKVTNTP